MASTDEDEVPGNPPHVTFRDIQRPYITSNPSCIQLSRAARNYEFKNIHLNALPTFNGHRTEDALDFLREYYGVIDTLPLNGLSEDELKLRCFPYCLKGEARQWLLRLPEASITSWVEMYEQFILKYYSPQKTSELRDKIHFFTQQNDESFYEAWERYNLLISQCPHHQFPHILLMDFFYNGLNSENQCKVDNAAHGDPNTMTAEEREEIYKTLAANSRQKAIRGRRAALNEVTTSDVSHELRDLTKNLNLLLKNFNSVNSLPSTTNSNHARYDGEEVNYIGAGYDRVNSKNDPYSNTYNPGWRNHPNFSWKNSAPQGPQAPPGFQQQRNTLEDRTTKLEEALAQMATLQANHMKSMNQEIDQLKQAVASTQASVKNMESQMGNSIKNVEAQINNLTSLLTGKGQNKFPSNTEVNPREQVMALTLRNGKVLQEVDLATKKMSNRASEQKNDEGDEVIEVPKANLMTQGCPMPSAVKPLVPPIPYPERLQKKDPDSGFQKFLEMLKKIQINIPFIEAIANMPSYAKYLKQLVSNKKRLEECSMVTLTEECSAILQRKLPPKLKDPGSFSIPCTIGSTTINNCLCDLGASVSLMPYSLCKKLGITYFKETNVTLQLADRSIRYPMGKIEDVLVKVGKLYIPTDFLILDIEGDIPLILGRPFLATSGTLIDVPKGELTFRVGKNKEIFRFAKATNLPTLDEPLCSINMIQDECTQPQDSPSYAFEDKGGTIEEKTDNEFPRLSKEQETSPQKNATTHVIESNWHVPCILTRNLSTYGRMKFNWERKVSSEPEGQMFTPYSKGIS